MNNQQSNLPVPILSPEEIIFLDIPTQYSNLNSFQLYIHWIESEPSLNSKEKVRRQKIIDNLKEKEKEKIKKQKNEFTKLLLEKKEDFTKYKDEIDSGFKEFIKNNWEPFLPWITDLESFFVFKINERWAFELWKNDFEDELWELLFYRFVYNFLRKKEEKKILKKDNDQIDTIRENIWIWNNLTQEDYTTFSVKNWETNTNPWTFWYEYRNIACKKLKDSWNFEWWKYRIYIDIPYWKLELLRDLSIQISSKLKIPIWFKFLDVEKSHQSDVSNNSDITRFVANFASIEDAKKFYSELSKLLEYQKITPDRDTDFYWYKLDDKSTFASWFRENREAFERIKKAKRNSDWTYTYTWINWKEITISHQEYNEIIKKFWGNKTLKEIWEEN